MSIQVILIPASDVEGMANHQPGTIGLPERTYPMYVELDPPALNSSYISGDSEGANLLLVVPPIQQKVDFETKWYNLVGKEHVVSDCVRIIKYLRRAKSPRVFLPEAGLSSVPMKNSVRVQNSIQAVYNLNLIKFIQSQGSLDSIYMRVALGAAYIPLVPFTELSL